MLVIITYRTTYFASVQKWEFLIGFYLTLNRVFCISILYIWDIIVRLCLPLGNLKLLKGDFLGKCHFKSSTQKCGSFRSPLSFDTVARTLLQQDLWSKKQTVFWESNAVVPTMRADDYILLASLFCTHTLTGIFGHIKSAHHFHIL